MKLEKRRDKRVEDEKKTKPKKSIWEAWAMDSKQKKECQDGDGMRNNIYRYQ